MHHNKLVLALVGGLIVTLTTAGTVAQTAPAEAATTRMSSACSSVPTTTTESDGVPGTVFYKRLQCFGSMAGSGYAGPIDGVMGPNSWQSVAIQLIVRGHFYGNSIPNWESPDTVAALQHWAAAHGRYSGPIDGVWGPNSYRGVAWMLNRSF